MLTVFVSKLQQRGTIHPSCINNDEIYSLLDLNLSSDAAATITALQTAKTNFLSVIEFMPGHVKSVLLESADKDYVYSGSVWETRESFDSMISNVQENHFELLTTYNTLRTNFFKWASIEFNNGKIITIENISMLTFENIDQLNANLQIEISTPFNLSQ